MRSRVQLLGVALLGVAAAAAVWRAIAPDSAGGRTEPPAVTALAVALPAVPTPIVYAAVGAGGLPGMAAARSAGLQPTPTLVAPTSTPEPTAAPSATPEPTATTAPPLAPPERAAVNGVPWEAIVVMPDDVIANSRAIYERGQLLGRNQRAYSKVGDSTIEAPHFMERFDSGPYNLGAYAYLQPAVEHFAGSHSRDSAAVRIGLHSWSANDPMWADPGCLPNETPVACEIRLNNPCVLLIRLGTNDVGVGAMFDANIRQIVDTAVAAGVVPVIGTKGDRHEGSNENNDILRRIAADYRIPLWEYDRVADMLPGRGLDVDAAHMNTFYSHDYTDPTAFTRGHAMHNLTALMVLDAVWRLVIQTP